MTEATATKDEGEEVTLDMDEIELAERRLLRVLAKSFLEGTVYATDVILFTNRIGISAELRARYALDRVNWEDMRATVRRHLFCYIEEVEDGKTDRLMLENEERLANRIWALSSIYPIMLEARPGYSISNWIDDPYTMTDWVMKKLKDWEAQSGGYFQEGFEDPAEESLWLSTAERVLDIPSSDMPDELRRAFALAAALLWGEG